MASGVSINIHKKLIFVANFTLEHFFDIAAFKLTVDVERVRFHHASFLFKKILKVLFVSLTML
jgi:hypothetical protein